MRRRLLCLVSVSVILIGAWHPSYAQSQEQEEPLPRHEASAYVKVMPSRSLKAQPGTMSIIESGTEYQYSFKAFERLPVVLSLGAQQYSIDESAPVSLPTQLTGVNFGVETTVPLFAFKDSYLRVQLLPSWNTDNWGVASSAFRVPVHVFAIYQPSERLTWVGGVAVYHDFEERVFPIFGFIYKPNNALTIQCTPGDPHIAYRLNNKLTVFAQGAFSDKEFEVTKDGLKGVVLRYRDVGAGAGFDYALNKAVTCSFSSGYQFKRYLQYGDSLGKVNSKGGQYCEFKVEVNL